MVVETEIGELADAHQQGAGVVVDVGETEEHADGHVAGAAAAPLGELARNERLYGICVSGDRFAVAAPWLTRADFDAVPVVGGIQAWGPPLRPRVPAWTEQKP